MNGVLTGVLEICYQIKFLFFCDNKTKYSKSRNQFNNKFLLSIHSWLPPRTSLMPIQSEATVSGIVALLHAKRRIWLKLILKVQVARMKGHLEKQVPSWSQWHNQAPKKIWTKIIDHIESEPKKERRAA